ncbi:MAG TPA: DUF2637 domain-containing protein [Asanoa sp.]|nr:DUF2637 domain-containing protein [Asanoa sp.]
MAIKSPAPTSHQSVLITLAVIAAVATIALTGIAFWLSYESLHDLAASHHLHGPRAWAWPATLDSFIIIGETLTLRASLARRIDWAAIALTAAGSVGSIVLNIASVGDTDALTRVVAAVPPVAALLAFGALMRQLHGALAARVATPVTDAIVPRNAELLPIVPPATPPVPPPPPDGETLTTSEVAERLNVAPATVRTWVHRRKLTPIATDPDGGHLFATAAVAALKDEAAK